MLKVYKNHYMAKKDFIHQFSSACYWFNLSKEEARVIRRIVNRELKLLEKKQ